MEQNMEDFWTGNQFRENGASEQITSIIKTQVTSHEMDWMKQGDTGNQSTLLGKRLKAGVPKAGPTSVCKDTESIN